MKKRQLAILFSVVFMDMIGFGFIIPILPDIIKNFGSTQEMFGYALGVYALGQFIAAPLLGSLSDRYGRKPILLFSIGGTFLSLLLLGFSRSVMWIIISRLLDGLTGGNITVAHSYIADSTSEEDRSKGFGIIGMAFGLGFIFGPLFGGLLFSISMQAPAFVAAGIALINLFVIKFILPESLSKENRTHFRKIRIIDVNAFRQVFSGTNTRRFLSIILFYTLAFNVFETMFSSHSLLAVNLSPRAIGFVLAYMGILIAIMQGGFIGKLTKKYREMSLLNISNLILVFSILAWSFVTNIFQLAIVIIPISFAAAIQSVLQKSQLSKSSSAKNQGMVMGVSTSLESFTRVLAPIAGGVMLSRIGYWAPGVFSSIVLIIPLITISAYKIGNRTLASEEEG